MSLFLLLLLLPFLCAKLFCFSWLFLLFFISFWYKCISCFIREFSILVVSAHRSMPYFGVWLSIWTFFGSLFTLFIWMFIVSPRCFTTTTMAYNITVLGVKNPSQTFCLPLQFPDTVFQFAVAACVLFCTIFTRFYWFWFSLLFFAFIYFIVASNLFYLIRSLYFLWFIWFDDDDNRCFNIDFHHQLNNNIYQYFLSFLNGIN